MDERVLLARHDRLWERRSEVLRRWQDLWSECKRRRLAVDREARSGEVAIRRAAGGLDAGQRRWAEQHASYAARPASRSGRQSVITWIYRRELIRSAESRARRRADAAACALAQTEAELADATRELLLAWGEEAAAATGQTTRRLRALSRIAERRD